MKTLPPRVRLTTAHVLLLLLLLGGMGLAWWVNDARRIANTRKLEADLAQSRIAVGILHLSDNVGNLLLRPGLTEDKLVCEEVRNELTASLAVVQARLAGGPESSYRKLRDFSRGKLIPFHDRVVELAATNTAKASSYFNENLPYIRQEARILQEDLGTALFEAGSKADKHALTVTFIGAGAAVVLFALSILVFWTQSAALSNATGRVLDVLERMRRGDFTQRFSGNGSTEIGLLGEGLNGLAADLSALVGQVQRSGIQVNATATQIAASAKEQQSTAHEIAATTAEIGATSKRICDTSKELVKTMNEVSHVAEDTAQVANTGQSALGRMETTMRQIMEASGSISAKLSVLSEKTANINSVVTTITKVADQTNLLSLNAAIEAEKAGEYGLGFAVVAMEIRRLADQTAVATYDIEKTVKEMQAAVAAGVMGMDKFAEEVRQGVEEVRQVGVQLARIIHQVQALTPRFQMVNEGMHAQAGGAEQISETLAQLSEAAHQTAESLQQSNLAIEQLNEAARGLQGSVIRFKLEN